VTYQEAPSRVQIAQTNCAASDPADQLGISQALLERKGMLYVVARPDTPSDVLSSIRTAYYSSPLYDVGRLLAEILADAYGRSIHAVLPGAVVVLGADVYLVGSPGMVAWITRFEGVQCVFDVRRRIGLPAELRLRPSYAVDWELHQSHWRLTTGDSLVVLASEDCDLSDEQVLRLAMRHGTVQALAEAVSRAAQGAEQHRDTVLVFRARGFTPMPAFPSEPPARQAGQPRSMSDEWAKRRGVSPIWIALLVAALALAMTVHFVGTESAMSALRDYVRIAFGPEPTATPTLEPTPTPSEPSVELLPGPALASPPDGAQFKGGEVELRWTWGQRLESGQAFDARVARAGQTPASVAVTADLVTSYQPVHPGWYEWTVVVVDGAGHEVSESAPIGTFFWTSD